MPERSFEAIKDHLVCGAWLFIYLHEHNIKECNIAIIPFQMLERMRNAFKLFSYWGYS